MSTDGAGPGLHDELVTADVRRSEVLHDGAVWDVRADTFVYEGQELTREVVDHPGAVAVLAVDDDDQVVLIRQYRHPVAALDWEIPAGLLDVADEDPVVGARRELAEEVDLVADEWAVLTDLWTSPGGMSEAIRIYLARGLRPVPEAERFEREHEEAHLVVRRVDLDEVHAAVLAGTVHNSTLMIAVLAAHAQRAQGWSGLRPADSPWPEHPGRR